MLSVASFIISLLAWASLVGSLWIDNSYLYYKDHSFSGSAVLIIILMNLAGLIFSLLGRNENSKLKAPGWFLNALLLTVLVGMKVFEAFLN